MPSFTTKTQLSVNCPVPIEEKFVDGALIITQKYVRFVIQDLGHSNINF